MSVDLTESSIAQWCPDRERHRCGYCKNPAGSISYGMFTEQLTVEDYKDLIDRGWRRSGRYCYKPTMDKTCCPQYTIKCDATEFTLNKSHKKIIKKFNKFLKDGVFNKNTPPNSQDNEEETSSEIPGYNKHSAINLSKSITITQNSDCKMITKDTPRESLILQSQPGNSSENIQDVPNSVLKSVQKSSKDSLGPDPNKPPCKKAKLIRLERKKEKLMQKGQTLEPTSHSNNQKSLSQFLEEIPANSKHKLKLKLILTSTSSAEWEQVKDIEFNLYSKYQTIVHNNSPGSVTMSGFTRFLVTSPLKSKPFPNGIEGPGYGSFHQQYWLDDKLIAVGVIDILPGCVSSVYFFYDPDYRDLSLGTYGSLREIQLVQNLAKKIPDLKYYYMGFYIHSCPKMRYKGNLNPSYLACPETYVWVPISKCLEKLDASKYSRLNEDIDAIDTNACNDPKEIDSIKVVYDYKLMHVRDFLRISKGGREMFENIANLVGKKSSHSIIFWID
ncbi:unnamed protein product [Ceutorhynchus assimilis]|uniref:Arginyl-tRNA--protein transferase 1 n=1 Tax=Ceutorhynchus assimilis TaxID=467358 RepID=A0A9P0GQX4_9CUCU|nr:unnamed protein product [Ceutorhynchus assimilis]